jgi:hypothetical protein
VYQREREDSNQPTSLDLRTGKSESKQRTGWYWLYATNQPSKQRTKIYLATYWLDWLTGTEIFWAANLLTLLAYNQPIDWMQTNKQETYYKKSVSSSNQPQRKWLTGWQQATNKKCSLV